MRNGMTWFARVAARLWLAGSFAQAYGEEPLADDATVVALAVALPSVGEPEAAPPDSAAGRPAEVELVATVRAKALRFDEVPTADVLLPQGGARRWCWRTERVNLPAQPEPGVVYRDVEVRLTVSGDRDEVTSVLARAKRTARGIRFEPDAAVMGAAAGESARALPDPEPVQGAEPR